MAGVQRDRNYPGGIYIASATGNRIARHDVSINYARELRTESTFSPQIFIELRRAYLREIVEARQRHEDDETSLLDVCK